jgi:hypothetical protein
MSSAKPTGGPAFPVPGLHEDEDFNGMNLRDYFAAKAMQSMLANGQRIEGNDAIQKRAAYAYAMADAMLAARAEVKP